MYMPERVVVQIRRRRPHRDERRRPVVAAAAALQLEFERLVGIARVVEARESCRSRAAACRSRDENSAHTCPAVALVAAARAMFVPSW